MTETSSLSSTVGTYWKKDDKLCTTCKWDSQCYTNKRELIQCLTCMKWVCGIWNKG